ncbi:MAG: hypothetical protein K0V04_46610 [Deltaproteobacteria bacterium]|nr:hypothetical protein [Deltaproteobacteria bacterium]
MSQRWVDAQEVMRLARAQIPVLMAERRRIQAASAQHQVQLKALHGEIYKAWEYLATVLVPGIVPENLEWASRLLSLPPIGAQAVQAAMVQDRDRLQATMANLDDNDDYVHREARLNACSIHLTELAESIAPLQDALSLYHSLPHWDELLDSGYGTDAYAGKWYTLSYYQHWKYGDQAVAALGEQFGVKTFAELRARYEQEKAAWDQLVTSRTEYQRQQHAVQSAVQQYTEAERHLANLASRHLSRVRGVVIEHLSPLGRDQLAKMLASYETGLVALKRLDGLEAKYRYLEITHQRWVLEPAAGIEKALRKAQRDLVKLQRPKHVYRRFPSADIERRFMDRQPKWDKRWTRYQDSRTRLIGFDDYGTYDFDDATPWWSVMTGDAVKARFIPEVAVYYEHRSATKQHSQEDHEQQAFAAVASAADYDDGRDDFDDMS